MVVPKAAIALLMMHKMERCLQKDAAYKSNWHIRFANERRSLTVEIRTEECDLTSREMPMREVSIASAGGGDSTIDDTQNGAMSAKGCRQSTKLVDSVRVR